MEFAGLQCPGPDAVVLAQSGEEHRADRHIDADAERVGAADHLEQPGLGQLFDQAPVLRQHPGVVHPDAVADQTVQGFAESGGEAEARDHFRDALLFLLAAHVDAHQGLRALDRLGLAEVHDVHRSLMGIEQFFDGFVHRGLHVVVVQRDRPFGGGYGDRIPPGALGEFLFETAHIAQRGAHQQELGLRQFEQRNLPGPTALRIGEVVELVHHHGAHRSGRAFAQGDIGQDLRSAADDRRLRVDRGIAGDHAHVLRTEDLDQGEELLRDQGLDRRGVVAAFPGRQRGEMRGHGHQGFAGAGRRGQNDVVATGEFQHGFVLGRVEAQPLSRAPVQESVVNGVRVFAGHRQLVKECHRLQPSRKPSAARPSARFGNRDDSMLGSRRWQRARRLQ